MLLCVDALCGVTRITREHLAVAVALEVPTALVVTKADAVDARQLQLLLQQLRQLLAPLLGSPQQQQQLSTRQSAEAMTETAAATAAEPAGAGDSAGCPDGVPVVLTEPQAARLADTLSELHSCTAAALDASFRQVTFPVFTVSCVSGAGLSLLHAFLSRLQPVSTSRSSRQCGAAAAPVGSHSSGVQPSCAAGSAAAVEPQMQQQQPASSSSRPWQEAAAAGGVCAATVAGDVGDVQRQRLEMEGSSSLWVTQQLAATAAAAAALDAGSSRVAAAAGASDGAGFDADTAAAAAVSDADAAAAVAAGHFQVVHTYDVEGVGWVVSGIAVSGERCKGHVHSPKLVSLCHHEQLQNRCVVCPDRLLPLLHD